MIFFIIGKPGSGKTTAALILKKILRESKFKDRNIHYLNDRDTLLNFSKKEILKNKIKPIDENNFTVIDDSIYLDALLDVKKNISNKEDMDFIIIEFSRNDYKSAFRVFKNILENRKAFILYLKTDYKKCKERNSNREYKVPEDEMESFFKTDDIEFLEKSNVANHMRIIDNDKDSITQVDLIDSIKSTLKKITYL